MAGRGSDELMELLSELAALQRENAERLLRVERCLTLVTAALPSLASDLGGAPAGDRSESGHSLTGEERRMLLEDAADVLDQDRDGEARPRRLLDS